MPIFSMATRNRCFDPNLKISGGAKNWVHINNLISITILAFESLREGKSTLLRVPNGAYLSGQKQRATWQRIGCFIQKGPSNWRSRMKNSSMIPLVIALGL